LCIPNKLFTIIVSELLNSHCGTNWPQGRKNAANAFGAYWWRTSVYRWFTLCRRRGLWEMLV